MKVGVFLLICIAVIYTWLSWPFGIDEHALLDGKLLEARGQYGDSFGALNTLFTGLAFAGVAFSIYLQLAADKERNKERRKDEFENRLFHLTDAVRSHVRSMDLKSEVTGRVSNGKDCFNLIIRKLTEVVREVHPEDDRPAKVIIDSYDSLYRKYQDDLGPYFRMLYHVFRFIDRSDVDGKLEYVDFVRAELSSAELCLIEVNGLTERGRKFKLLIEQYNIGKHAPRDTRFDPANAIRGEYSIKRIE